MKSYASKLIKKLLPLSIMMLNAAYSICQRSPVDSLQKRILHESNDTTRIRLLYSLGSYYIVQRFDSAIYYLAQSIDLAEKINYPLGIHAGYARLAFGLNTVSNYSEALKMAQKSLLIAEKFRDDSLRRMSMAESYHIMSGVNRRMNYDTIALDYAKRAIQLYQEAGASTNQWNFGPSLNISLIYLKWKNLDSALLYARQAYDIELHYPPREQAALSAVAATLANVFEEKGDYVNARKIYGIALDTMKKFNAPLLKVRLFNNIARFFLKIGDTDSSIYFSKTGLALCRNGQFGEHALDAANLLAQTYETLKIPDSALKYIKIGRAIKDTIFSQERLQQFQLLNFSEAQRQKDIEAAKEKLRNQLRFYGLLGTAAGLLLLTLILYRNNRNKQRANKLLESQKKEIDQQRALAENALHELKATQSQLIQSEKMASLGEMTAGIAHEIQNPLNFVNNFSEVNSELLDEMNKAWEEGNAKEARALSEGIKQNLEKINHHGKRADAIVKGMLQHSRTSQGHKESVDLNAMVEEYLRLSYHGMRVKDKFFNAKFSTSLDESLGKINIVPQDMGRVFVNLFNNAFYSINEKRKGPDKHYEPELTVSTRRMANKVEIRIRDNGMGISQKNIDKIFQPFFTTKPTGQGTGLGLSLSYDIIIKEHGGEIKVETVEGEYTEFIISLPAF